MFSIWRATSISNFLTSWLTQKSIQSSISRGAQIKARIVIISRKWNSINRLNIFYLRNSIRESQIHLFGLLQCYLVRIWQNWSSGAKSIIWQCHLACSRWITPTYHNNTTIGLLRKVIRSKPLQPKMAHAVFMAKAIFWLPKRGENLGFEAIKWFLL